MTLSRVASGMEPTFSASDRKGFMQRRVCNRPESTGICIGKWMWVKYLDIARPLINPSNTRGLVGE